MGRFYISIFLLIFTSSAFAASLLDEWEPKVSFDGRVGFVYYKNSSLYPVTISLWHPDSKSKYKQWQVNGQDTLSVELGIGSDWGFQIGTGPVKTLSNVSSWSNHSWYVSSELFYENNQNVVTAPPVTESNTYKTEKPDRTPPTIIVSTPEVKRGIKLTARNTSIAVTGRAESKVGVAEVTVNGQPAALDESGNFSAEILLKVGDNQITITALDINKNTATEQFTIKREAGQVAHAKTPEKPLVEAKHEGKAYALVIGINAYKYIAPLKTAINDATEVAAVLRSLYGFETTVLTDDRANRSYIMKELNALKNRVNPEDRLLIYYAGHGYNDSETETSYWLPVEAEQNDPTNWINAKDITDQLKRARAKQVIVVADSCYSGTMARALDPSLSGRGNRENFLKKLIEKPSRVLIASGGNEPVSDSGGTKHSIFAEVFINALKNPPEPVFTAEELLTRQIKESVAGRAEQTPEYKIIRNSGHDGGDFVFEKRP